MGPDGAHRTAAHRPSRFVDAVGAGDAFTAVVVAGLGAGRQPAEILARAARFAAAICGIRGATDRDPQFYRDVRAFAATAGRASHDAPDEGGSGG